MDLDFVGYRGVVLHPYPATMPLPVAKRLIDECSQPGATVLDPFAGSGTTLRAAALGNRRSIGLEINPLACLIAEVGLQPFEKKFDPGLYQAARSRVWGALTGMPPLLPDKSLMPRVERWFHPVAIHELGQLAGAVAAVPATSAERAYLLLALSRTARASSRARLGELKLWRRAGSDVKVTPGEVLSRFFNEAIDLGASLLELRAQAPPQPGESRVIRGDARAGIRRVKEVDLVLTSPPYGDAWTTVAYGNFSMLNRIWLGTVDPTFTEGDPAKEDALSIGGLLRQRTESGIYDVRATSLTLAATHQQVHAINASRAQDMLRFFTDMHELWTDIARRVVQEGVVTIVAGPRRWAGVHIDTGRVFTEMVVDMGFVSTERYHRRITGKRLPRATRQGASGEGPTINEETVDILRRLAETVPAMDPESMA